MASTEAIKFADFLAALRWLRSELGLVELAATHV
jgi:hypothetical protein